MEKTKEQSFTKDDFKSATDLVKILDNKYDVQTINSAMKELLKKGATIRVWTSARPLIYKAKWSHMKLAGKRPPLRLHPLGLDKFKEYLEKRK